LVHIWRTGVIVIVVVAGCVTTVFIWPPAWPWLVPLAAATAAAALSAVLLARPPLKKKKKKKKKTRAGRLLSSNKRVTLSWRRHLHYRTIVITGDGAVRARSAGDLLSGLSENYDDKVRRAVTELVDKGQLLFNPPKQMRFGQTERVEVRVTRTLEMDAELLKHLRGRGEPQLKEIQTAPKMAVTLKSVGGGFDIQPFSDEEQDVTQDEVTAWEFDIRALKPGQQLLNLCVSLRIPVQGQPVMHKSIPVFEAKIDVQVGFPTRVGLVISAAKWQWIIGTAVVILVGVSTVIATLHH
jgi:hypothetical protein